MEGVITAVGFAASIVTLLAVVGDSAQTVHDLWKNFKDSPRNLGKLSHIISESEALLREMETASEAFERVSIPESLLLRWRSTSANVLQDFEALRSEMKKIVECTKGKELTKRHVRQRIKHFFSDHALERHCKQLSAHKADMSYIHSLMQRCVKLCSPYTGYPLTIGQFAFTPAGARSCRYKATD